MMEALRREPVGRLLLVEDEGEVCAFLTEELEGAGYQVTCVANDEEAYQPLDQGWRSFTALILDVNLGRGTTGFDIARYARRLSPRIPVVFTTGFNAETSVDRYGVADSVFVPKPFSGGDMLTAIRQLTPAGP